MTTGTAMRRAGATAALLLALTAASGASADEFQPLFNGKDFAGWVLPGDKALFAVEDGRASLVAAARELAAESRHSEALAALDRAAQLRRTDDGLRLRAAVLLLARDFAGTLRAYDELASGR